MKKTIYLLLIILNILILSIISVNNCYYTYSKSPHKPPSNPESIETPTRRIPQEKSISSHSRNLILESSYIEYFEIPGLSDISDPESLRTFSVPVKNQSHIDRFRRLTTKESNNYRTHHSTDCKPSYNSALVFQKDLQKETILFSLDCGIIYLYQEKLYLDVGLERMEIENIFRQIRSGR